jgi:hypothetical protein
MISAMPAISRNGPDDVVGRLDAISPVEHHALEAIRIVGLVRDFPGDRRDSLDGIRQLDAGFFHGDRLFLGLGLEGRQITADVGERIRSLVDGRVQYDEVVLDPFNVLVMIWLTAAALWAVPAESASLRPVTLSAASFTVAKKPPREPMRLPR